MNFVTLKDENKPLFENNKGLCFDVTVSSYYDELSTNDVLGRIGIFIIFPSPFDLCRLNTLRCRHQNGKYLQCLGILVRRPVAAAPSPSWRLSRKSIPGYEQVYVQSSPIL